MALVIAITAVAILTVLLADFHESTSTAFAVSVGQEESLQAEYLAKSGLNLTRMLVANEPAIRQVVGPMYQMAFGRSAPQLPVWTLADEILRPFCRPERASAYSSVEGLGDLPGDGHCEILAFAENSRINVSDPLVWDGDRARRSVAMQLFAHMGGYQSPSRFDPLFANRDADGQFTSRLDVVTSLIDWWDEDNDRTVFDPGASTISSAGSEDDFYQRLDGDPYRIKNAPFDSLEELRLVRGIGDDFWATFVEPEPDNPETRVVTIYGSGYVNPNEAEPEVLLARVCSYVEDQSLCTDAAEAAKFVQLFRTVKSMIPIPLFTNSDDFVNFLQGRGGPRDIWPLLVGFLGEDNPLLFRPITIPPNIVNELHESFVTVARILTIYVRGRVGCRQDEDDPFGDPICHSEVRVNTVINTDPEWQPPPPNPGRMPPLGIFHYYRME